MGDAAGNAVDDRVETSWRSEYSPPASLPPSITLDLHEARAVRAPGYKPPVTASAAELNVAYQPPGS